MDTYLLRNLDIKVGMEGEYPTFEALVSDMMIHPRNDFNLLNTLNIRSLDEFIDEFIGKDGEFDEDRAMNYCLDKLDGVDVDDIEEQDEDDIEEQNYLDWADHQTDLAMGK